MAAWKYTAPAFLVPIAFTIAPEGVGLLAQGQMSSILLTSVTALAGVVAIAAALGRRRLWPVLLVGGLALLYPAWWADLLGAALAALTLLAGRAEKV
jgi:TRAP-type uncharacterized transport system fused permease subunit